jgi:hypothetical protein
MELINTDESMSHSGNDGNLLGDDEGSFHEGILMEDEDFPVDEFTRKRLPKPEDFFMN